jgi:hypothetical protein
MKHTTQYRYEEQMKSWLDWASENFDKKKYVGGSTEHWKWNQTRKNRPIKPGLNVWLMYEDWIKKTFDNPTVSNGGTWRNTYSNPICLHYTDACPEFKAMLDWMEEKE